MKATVILALSLFCAVAVAQLASPYSNSVYPAQTFTATGQTGTVIQLNGLSGSSTLGSSFASGAITLTGISLTTATFSLLGSADNGVTFYALPISAVQMPGSTATSVIATSNGFYQVSLTGITHVKFVTSGTFTATSVSLVLTATPNVGVPPSGGGTAPNVFPSTSGLVVGTSQSTSRNAISSDLISLLGYTPTNPATNLLPLTAFVPQASSATPLYLLAHMRDDSQNLHIGYSQDGQLFTDIRAGYSSPGYLRDPSVLYANGKFWFVASQAQQTITGCTPATFTSNGLQFFSSTDLIHFSSMSQIVIASSGICSAFAPRFFTDPVSGNYYVTEFAGASSTPGSTIYISQFNATSGTFGSFTALTVSGDSGAGFFDGRLFFNSGTYYLLYVSASSGGNQNIHIATSSTLNGTYTYNGTNDPFAFGNSVENPDWTLLTNGKIRVYVDSFANDPFGQGRIYTRKFVDTSNNFTIVGAVTQTTGVQQEAGTVIQVTNPTEALTVYNAATAAPPGSYASPVGIDGPGLHPYSLYLNMFGANALNPNLLRGIGMQNADGTTTGWWSCDAAVCGVPVGSAGKIIHWNAPGNYGHEQWITGTDTESSLLVASNCTPGTNIATCPNNASVWAFGENISNLGAFNHHYFWFNAALNYVPMWLGSVTGETHITRGITLGNQTSSGTIGQTTSVAGVDSPAAGVVEANNGTLGNANGTYKASYFIGAQTVTIGGGVNGTPTCLSSATCSMTSGEINYVTSAASAAQTQVFTVIGSNTSATVSPNCVVGAGNAAAALAAPYTSFLGLNSGKALLGVAFANATTSGTTYIVNYVCH